jgi:hypothetical protein
VLLREYDFQPQERTWIHGTQMNEAMQQVSGNSEPATLLPALNSILAKYPDFAVGYIARLASLCQSKNQAAILSDISSAQHYLGGFHEGDDYLASLLSMRAKIEHLAGDDSKAREVQHRCASVFMAFGRHGISEPTRYRRKHVVGLAAHQADSPDYQHQNHGQNNSVLSDVLTFLVAPESLNESSHFAHLPRTKSSLTLRVAVAERRCIRGVAR